MDDVSPMDQELQMFNQQNGPKRLHITPGRLHLGLLTGPQKLQVDFVRDVVDSASRTCSEVVCTNVLSKMGFPFEYRTKPYEG